MMSNSYIIELERLRTDLRDRLRSRYITCTNDEPLNSLIPKVSNIGYWDVNDKTTPGYVTDGLIALYDGIKNTRAGHSEEMVTKWEDLSGNDNDLTSLSVPSMIFTGDSAVVYKNIAQCGLIYPTLSDTIVTAEVVFRVLDYTPSYQSIAGFGKSKQKLIVLEEYSNSVLFKTDGQCYEIDRTVRNSLSIDYSNQTILINGAIPNTTGHSDSFSTTPANDITLCRYSPSIGSGFCGELCSIRLYNRTLTANEKSQNLAIDAERFGISTE